jgi:acyl-CoA synthetase (AMP-forming)/AMP-acid ligase II
MAPLVGVDDPADDGVAHHVACREPLDCDSLDRFEPGDRVGIMSRTRYEWTLLDFACWQAGAVVVPIYETSSADQVEWILSDAQVRLAVVETVAHATVTESIRARVPALGPVLQLEDGAIGHLIDKGAGIADAEIARRSALVGPDDLATIIYTSGTTGRPKGIRPPLERNLPIDADNILVQIARAMSGASPDSVYLSPAPLYHAAPLRWCMTFTRIGSTVIVMEKFDPEDFLKAVEKYKVTHTQVVPTMFVKMLKLPEDVRKKYDVSSMTFAIHAAAPCPIPVKEQMIAWWGPVIDEYYAGSEGNGMTYVKSPDWLTHKGTVGRAIHGKVHICDEEGNELPIGEEGQVYFSGTTPPNYHNDPEKNKAALNPKHPDWSSLGDVGKLEEDGFLYLTDRKAFMIISGGVNIYQQETENVLITHPKVADVAVIGVPDEEFGEAVKAVVQPMPGIAPSEELAAELMAFAQANLSKLKCPKSIDFDPELPRHPTGKLYKRLIRDRYWGNKNSRIV